VGKAERSGGRGNFGRSSRIISITRIVRLSGDVSFLRPFARLLPAAPHKVTFSPALPGGPFTRPEITKGWLNTPRGLSGGFEAGGPSLKRKIGKEASRDPRKDKGWVGGGWCGVGVGVGGKGARGRDAAYSALRIAVN
jgi:hypothetical protein